ncbi:MAG: UDP-glucose--hexose-1-phosphate uridylyltransferase [Clostridia bacterium]|nr:UDP-glucose--hexose-1-phosphate uridylyltransferase [Clostridia bacterium]
MGLGLDLLIGELVEYGVVTHLIEEGDRRYVTNRLYDIFGVSGPEIGAAEGELLPHGVEVDDLERILEGLCDIAARRGLLPDNTVTYRDLFDTRLMATMVDRPSQIVRTFYDLYAESPKRATDYFYKLSCDSNYIRRYRVKRDMKWQTETPWGILDITVNLSKPEKDPKAIAAAKLQKQSGYPRCLLCKENEGYAGRVDHPARQNHRIIPLSLCGEEWFLQYSPYVYYNEHCIVFSASHAPMVIEERTFRLLFDFVRQFPHYTVGSNADLPIVGGSILTHEHFQGGCYEFPLNRAPVDRHFTVQGYEGVDLGVVRWPMSVLRLTGTDTDEMTRLAARILSVWRSYSDPSCEILAESEGEPHNTITPIAHREGERYVLDLVLHNNRVTEEHPLGLFHPHAELHHIKKENIGLIEVMGLAILPARLKSELAGIKECILQDRDVSLYPELASHAAWVSEIRARRSFTAESIGQILSEEVGLVFARVLEDAGVYKANEHGQRGIDRFVATLA